MPWIGVRNLSGYNHKVADGEKSGNPLKDPTPSTRLNPSRWRSFRNIVSSSMRLADLMMVSGRKVGS